MSSIKGQNDVFYSQFSRSPLSLNPALTGSFRGSLRVQGLYRYNDFTQSPSLSLDYNFRVNNSSPNWMGIGFNLQQDEYGDINPMNTTTALLSIAYHALVIPESQIYVSGGFGFGYWSLDVANISNYISESDIMNGTRIGISDLISENDLFRDALDTKIGVVIERPMTDRLGFKAGISYHHIASLNNGIVNEEARVSRQWCIVGGLRYELMRQLEIEPTIAYLNTPTSYMAVSMLNTIISTYDKKFAFDIGIGYRWRQSLVLGAGIQKDNFKISGTYDLENLPLRSAAEIAISWIFNISSKPDFEENPLILSY